MDAAKLTEVDRLGLGVEATRRGETFKLRLPFIRPAESRKELKEVLVEMTKAAHAAQAAAQPSEAT